MLSTSKQSSKYDESRSIGLADNVMLCRIKLVREIATVLEGSSKPPRPQGKIFGFAILRYRLSFWLRYDVPGCRMYGFCPVPAGVDMLKAGW